MRYFVALSAFQESFKRRVLVDRDGNPWIIGQKGYAPAGGWPSYVAEKGYGILLSYGWLRDIILAQQTKRRNANGTCHLIDRISFSVNQWHDELFGR